MVKQSAQPKDRRVLGRVRLDRLAYRIGMVQYPSLRSVLPAIGVLALNTQVQGYRTHQRTTG
jgi:hypothetical protein